MGRDHSEPKEGPHSLDGKSQGCGTPWKLQKTDPLFKSCEQGNETRIYSLSCVV